MTKREFSRIQRHKYFNRVIDKIPSMKTYYTAYAIAVAAGIGYLWLNQINMVEVLDKAGFLGFAIVFVLLILPVVIFRIKRWHRE